MIGGSLSNPVPRLLGPGWTLFEQYPYLLPSIIAGSSGLLAWALGVSLVPEVSEKTHLGLGKSRGSADKCRRYRAPYDADDLANPTSMTLAFTSIHMTTPTEPRRDC